jgi:hypothetical protein
LRWDKPAFRFLHRKGKNRPEAGNSSERSSNASRGLARLTGRPLEASRLSEAISLHAEIDRLRGELLARRPFLPMSDASLYRLLRRGEYLWRGDHLEELALAARGIREALVRRDVPIMVSGYVPEPMSVFECLESAGAFVAADDYAAIGRRIPLSPPPADGAPLDRLSAMPFRMPPTRPARPKPARGWNTPFAFPPPRGRGLVQHVPKFCEPRTSTSLNPQGVRRHRPPVLLL